MSKLTEWSREMLAGLTPGEWVAVNIYPHRCEVVTPNDVLVAVMRDEHRAEDACFIAAAPKMVESLIAEVEAAHATLQRVEKLIDEWPQGYYPDTLRAALESK